MYQRAHQETSDASTLQKLESLARVQDKTVPIPAVDSFHNRWSVQVILRSAQKMLCLRGLVQAQLPIR